MANRSIAIPTSKEVCLAMAMWALFLAIGPLIAQVALGQTQLSNTLTATLANPMTFSPSTDKLLAAGGGLSVFNTSNSDPSQWSGSYIFWDNPGSYTFTSVAYSPDGRWVAALGTTTNWDGIVIYNVSDMAGSGGSYTFTNLQAQRTIGGTQYMQGKLGGLAFTPDSSMLVNSYCSLGGCEIHMWSVSNFVKGSIDSAPDGTMSMPGSWNSGRLQGVAIHPSGNWVAVGQSGGNMYLLSMSGMTLSFSFNHSATVSSNGGYAANTYISFSSDGTKLAWGYTYEAPYVRAFTTASGIGAAGSSVTITDTDIYVPSGFTGQWLLWALAFSPDSSTLAALNYRAAIASTVKLWSLNGAAGSSAVVSMAFNVSSNAQNLIYFTNKYLLIAGLNMNTNGIGIWSLVATTTTTGASTTSAAAATSTTGMAAATTQPCPADMGVQALTTYNSCVTSAGGMTGTSLNYTGLCSCVTTYLGAVSGCPGMSSLPSPSTYCLTTTPAPTFKPASSSSRSSTAFSMAVALVTFFLGAV